MVGEDAAIDIVNPAAVVVPAVRDTGGHGTKGLGGLDIVRGGGWWRCVPDGVDRQTISSAAVVTLGTSADHVALRG